MIVHHVPPNLKIYLPNCSRRRRSGTSPRLHFREWRGAWRKAGKSSLAQTLFRLIHQSKQPASHLPEPTLARKVGAG